MVGRDMGARQAADHLEPIVVTGARHERVEALLRIEVVDEVMAARSGEGRSAPLRRVRCMLGVPALVRTEEIAQT